MAKDQGWVKIGLLVLLLGRAGPAWGQDTLRITFSTVRPNQQGHLCFYDQNLADGLNNNNRNLVAVWLESANGGAYAKTLFRWGRTYLYNLEDWALASGMQVDSITAASQSCFSGETCGTGAGVVTAPGSLTTGAVDISSLPDGDYQVRLEITSCEGADEYRSGALQWDTPDVSFPFTKGRSNQPGVAVGDLFPFNGISLDYVPATGNAAPGVFAGEDQDVLPVGNSAGATLAGVVSDDAGAPATTWTLVGVEPPGGAATFVDPTSATTMVSFSVSGIYRLRLTATDTQGRSSFDEVVVSVNTRVLIPNADAEVYSGSVNANLGVLNTTRPPNSGPWVYAWGPQDAAPCNGNGSDRARGYTRFDVGGVVAGPIDLARLRLPVAEQRADTNKFHDYYLLGDGDDDWVPTQADDEATITWANQPLTAGDTSGIQSQIVGSYRHRTDFNAWAEIDLNLAVVAANDQNGLWTIFTEARGRCNGMGTAARENLINPELVIVEHWQANPNQAPVAVASAPGLVIDSDGDGAEVIHFDASGSTDDVGIVQYEWREGTVVANTLAANLMLGLGAHTIALTVTDGAGLVANDQVTVVVDDRYTPNASAALAQPIDGTPAGKIFDNLYAHTSAPSGGDWYFIDLAGGGDVSIDVIATGGDLDATLLGGDGATVLDTSSSGGSTETVVGSGLAAGSYYLRVDASGGAVGASTYELVVRINGPALTVALTPAQAAENLGTLVGVGQVTSSAPGPVTVALSSSDPTRLDLPMPTVTIAAGQTSATFDLALIDNGLADGDASVTIVASAPALNAGSASFLVIDEDMASATVAFERSAANASELGSPVSILKVVLSAPVAVDVVVPFVVSGTAQLGTDYRDDTGGLGRGSITIAAGTTTANLIFSVANDQLPESTETIVLTMGVAVGAVVGLPNMYTLTIADDDAPAPIDTEPVPSTGPTATTPSPVEGKCGCTDVDRGSSPWSALLALLMLVRRRPQRG